MCTCIVKGKLYGVPAVETADQLYNRHLDPLGKHLSVHIETGRPQD